MNKYDFGPPALTDEEVMRLESLFCYTDPQVAAALDVLAWPGASEEAREIARATLKRIRGC